MKIKIWKISEEIIYLKVLVMNIPEATLKIFLMQKLENLNLIFP
jgi:hypothetical protein